jgi:adenosine kinase
MPLFDGADLLGFLDQADYVTLNDYEAELMQERTGQKLETLAKKVQALIVTLGAKGSRVYTNGRALDIPAARPRAVKDPTGCGDAYRAGLLYGLLNGLDWETTGRIASLMGAIKIEHPGTQNHRFTQAGFEARFKESFGRAL